MVYGSCGLPGANDIREKQLIFGDPCVDRSRSRVNRVSKHSMAFLALNWSLEYFRTIIEQRNDARLCQKWRFVPPIFQLTLDALPHPKRCCRRRRLSHPSQQFLPYFFIFPAAHDLFFPITLRLLVSHTVKFPLAEHFRPFWAPNISNIPHSSKIAASDGKTPKNSENRGYNFLAKNHCFSTPNSVRCCTNNTKTTSEPRHCDNWLNTKNSVEVHGRSQKSIFRFLA